MTLKSILLRNILRHWTPFRLQYTPTVPYHCVNRPLLHQRAIWDLGYRSLVAQLLFPPECWRRWSSHALYPIRSRGSDLSGITMHATTTFCVSPCLIRIGTLVIGAFASLAGDEAAGLGAGTARSHHPLRQDLASPLADVDANMIHLPARMGEAAKAER